MKLENYTKNISIGLIQTTLDNIGAWGHAKSTKMSKFEEEWAIHEIQKFISSLHQDCAARKSGDNKTSTPDIILLPELAVPTGFSSKLKTIANDMQSIIIAGMDYKKSSVPGSKEVSNEAVIIVPSKWRGKRLYRSAMPRYVGKTYGAPREIEHLADMNYSFKNSPDVWIFDGGEIGKFGIAICYDLLDLDRLAMYKSKIQHLFVLAYNQDSTSFNHVAEAMARMIFCNIIICNCGKYGGSVVVSPYKDVFKRTVYRHCGLQLATAQMIDLPVQELIKYQTEDKPGKLFKERPPGYRGVIKITKQETLL